MTTTRELLEKIAALRSRLEKAKAAAERSDPPQPMGRPHQRSDGTRGPRLTARAAQLLQDARTLLGELKAHADHPLLAKEPSPLATLEREAANMLDVVARNLVNLPTSAAAQLRFAEGLSACLEAARLKIRLLQSALAEADHEFDQLHVLADLLRKYAQGESTELKPLLDLAQGVADQSSAGVPLRFPTCVHADSALFAARQGLSVARIHARILREDGLDPQRLAERLLPSLVHDIGLLDVPPDVLFKQGPLDDRERQWIHHHPRAGEAIARRLWPGGVGAAIEAIADHHERLDGSGYPARKSARHLGESARLLAVCDVYAALASARSHRDPLDPRTALTDTLLLADHGVLDRVQAEKLLRLGFYPAGAVVQLSDHSLALVIGPAKDATPSRPGAGKAHPGKATVIPLRNAAGEPATYPWPVDLSERAGLDIVRAVSPGERLALATTYPALTLD